MKRLLPRVVVIVLLIGVVIYSVASALGIENAELWRYFLASMLLVVGSALLALVVFGIIRLFRR